MGSFRNGDRRWLGLRRGLVTSAVLAGLVIQSMGLVLLRHGVVTHHRIIQEVLRFSDPGEPVISDAYLVPLLAERGWFSRRFLYCTSQSGLAGVVARLSRHGVDRWTYATVLEAPGERMALGETVVGSDGLQWMLVDRLQRSIGSRTIVLQRYRGN